MISQINKKKLIMEDIGSRNLALDIVFTKFEFTSFLNQ